jgi:hypothetical protein
VEVESEGVAALQRGDIRGLAVLVRLHQLKALRAAFGILGNRFEAEDAVELAADSEVALARILTRHPHNQLAALG